MERPHHDPLDALDHESDDDDNDLLDAPPLPGPAEPETDEPA